MSDKKLFSKRTYYSPQSLGSDQPGSAVNHPKTSNRSTHSNNMVFKSSATSQFLVI